MELDEARPKVDALLQAVHGALDAVSRRFYRQSATEASVSSLRSVADSLGQDDDPHWVYYAYRVIAKCENVLGNWPREAAVLVGAASKIAAMRLEFGEPGAGTLAFRVCELSEAASEVYRRHGEYSCAGLCLADAGHILESAGAHEDAASYYSQAAVLVYRHESTITRASGGAVGTGLHSAALDIAAVRNYARAGNLDGAKHTLDGAAMRTNDASADNTIVASMGLDEFGVTVFRALFAACEGRAEEVEARAVSLTQLCSREPSVALAAMSELIAALRDPENGGMDMQRACALSAVVPACARGLLGLAAAIRNDTVAAEDAAIELEMHLTAEQADVLALSVSRARERRRCAPR